MTSDPYRYFRPEAREIVERLGQGVLELEKAEPSRELVAGLLRHAHTLKGAARVVKQAEIAELAHAIEDLLEPVRGGGRTMERSQIERLLGALDQISERVSALGGPPVDRTAAQTGRAAPAPEEQVLRTVRTDIGELDVVLDNLSEIGVRAGTIRRSLEEVERARHLAELLSGQLNAPRAREPRADGSSAKAMRLAEELRLALSTLERGFAANLEGMERELQQAQGLTERLRLIPASTLFPSLQRVARDMAASEQRQVDFIAHGGEVRLDADVLAAIQPAMVQLVRNAVFHGVESPAERRAGGKSEAGQVKVELWREANRVVFACEDDGRGVDTAAVIRVAAAKGMVTRGLELLSPDAALELLLGGGGLSTSGTVTHAAGRGVGLDIVRHAATRIGGHITARTWPGVGTVIELSVPVSLSSIDALLVETSGVTAAIPIDAVRSVVRVKSDQMTHTPEGPAIVHEGRLVPFVALSRPLGLEDDDGQSGSRSAIIVSGGTGLAAVGVRRLIRTETLVVRPLPPATPAHPVVAGAAFDPEGTPQLVLDPDELVGAVLQTLRSSVAVSADKPLPPVLIIDDSLTTRMLEQSILESAGYQVALAASAEEALEMSRHNRYALFLVDVEMPGMDGFMFVERTRADPSLRNVPAILVTSRSSPADRLRGHEAGASAYITKSEFDQTELLQIIRKLVA